MTYQLICDSCTDLPANMLQSPHVTKVALTIQVGADTIVDDESFNQLELLKKMKAWHDAETGRPTLRAALYRPPHPCYNASRLVFTPSPSTEGDKPASLCSFDLSDLAIRLAVL